MTKIEKIIADKEAQLRILEALVNQLCSCECEYKYVETVRNQIKKELDDLRKLEK